MHHYNIYPTQQTRNQEQKIAYLIRNHTQLIPHQARQDVFEERQVDALGLDDFELAVARVQWEGRRGCFARFYGAGEEVEGEEFHCCGGWRVSAGKRGFVGGRGVEGKRE